ncbi:MAG: sugar phosphate isomerase/epimerase family protein [Spirochaetota bacterium]
MEIGVSNYTWTWAVGIEGCIPKNPLNSLGLLEKAKEHQVQVLQIADKPCLHSMNNAELDRIASKAREYGIKLEVGTRGIEPSRLNRYLNIAQRVGAKIVRTITHTLDTDAVSWLKEVLPDYSKAGVSIALENHDEHKTTELVRFLDKIASPYLGVCLDTVNSFAALEPPENVVKNLSPYTINVHIKDFDIVRVGHQLGFSIEGRPAGEGRLNVPWLIDYIEKKNRGRDPNGILELWTPFTGTLEKTIARENEWAIRSLRYLRGLIK